MTFAFDNIRMSGPRPVSLKKDSSFKTWLSSLHPSLHRPYLGLSAKLIFIVVVVSLIGVLSSSLLLLNWERGQLIDAARASASHLSIPIEASLEHAMRTHDTPMLDDIIGQMARESGLTSIRIMSPAGVVWTSSSSSEIGQPLDRLDTACASCDLEAALQSNNTTTSIRSKTGDGQLIFSISPIVNKQECFGCHDSKTRTLGVMVIEAPIGNLNSEIQEAYGRIALAAVFTFALLVGLMVPVLRRFVTAPVAELSRGVAEIAPENLDYRVPVSNRDELGRLTDAFEDMRRRLRVSQTQMEQRNNELALLYQVARVTEQLLDLEQTCDLTVRTVGETLKLDVVTIYLLDSNQGRFERVANWGLTEAQMQEIARRRETPGGDLTDNIAKMDQTFFLPDVSKSPDDLRHFEGLWEGLEGRSYVSVPLKSKGKVVGTMELLSKTGQPLTERDVEVLKAAGQQIGIAVDNTSLLAEIRRSEHAALTLYQLGTEVSSSLELDRVLNAVAAGARQALAADNGIVALQDKPSDDLVLRAISGTRQAEWKGQRISLNGQALSPHLTIDQTVNLVKIPRDIPPLVAGMIETEDVHSLLIVPLRRAGQVHGLVAVLSRQERRFTQEETNLLTRLAQQVVVAIENARLYQQVRHLAVLQERDRLAREMHDNLAQSLGYLNLKANLTSESLARGQVEQAQAGLRELKQITEEAYTDVREMLFSLRAQVASAQDLVPALEEYLAEYRAHYGLDARLVIDDSSLVQFPTDVAIQVNRIIQEALTNIRKHSGGKRAWVSFGRADGHVRISVRDDGRGLDLQSLELQQGHHYGIQIMRERAASVGGTLELSSQPGQGTCVTISLPAEGK